MKRKHRIVDRLAFVIPTGSLNFYIVVSLRMQRHYRTCISRVRWRRSFSVPVIELRALGRALCIASRLAMRAANIYLLTTELHLVRSVKYLLATILSRIRTFFRAFVAPKSSSFVCNVLSDNYVYRERRRLIVRETYNLFETEVSEQRVRLSSRFTNKVYIVTFTDHARTNTFVCACVCISNQYSRILFFILRKF